MVCLFVKALDYKVLGGRFFGVRRKKVERKIELFVNLQQHNSNTIEYY